MSETANGIRQVRVRVSSVDDLKQATIEPVNGEHFTGEGPITADTAFLAVRFDDGRNAVLRFDEPPSEQPGALINATLVEALPLGQ